MLSGLGATLATAAVAPVLAATPAEAAPPVPLTDPTTKYVRPPFQVQDQPWPGLASKMLPRPDHGETSYKGSGRLAGRRALITGGDSGMGRAAAIAYAREGADVAINYYPTEEPDAQEVVALIKAAGRKAVAIPGDLREEAFCQRLVADAVRQLGGLDIVVSNAGVAEMAGATSCELCPIETQQRVMDVNFFGAVRVVQAFLPLVRASRGTVVFNTALMAHTVIPFNAGYAASKCALEGWADSLRREVQPHGVRVAIVEAGYLNSELESKQRSATESTEALYPAATALHDAMHRSSGALAKRRSASPRRMSEQMVAAAQASKPRPRRIVGTGARTIWTIGCLPDRVQDALFRSVLTRLTRRP